MSDNDALVSAIVDALWGPNSDSDSSADTLDVVAGLIEFYRPDLVPKDG